LSSVIQTVNKPRETNFLILENGAYGQRIGKMCKLLGVKHHTESFPEDRSIDLKRVEDFLKNNKSFTNVVS